MMYCLVRSLRSRRPSTTALLVSPTIALRRGRRRKEPVDGPDPHLARLTDGQTVSLAHASPAFEIGHRLEGDQGVAAHRLGERRELRPVHQLQSPQDQLARQPDARLELV